MDPPTTPQPISVRSPIHASIIIGSRKVGLVGALNYGLKIARGHLIARLDGDDVCLPERLAQQVTYFGEHPECVLLGCDFDEIDPAGKLIGVNSYNVQGDQSLRWLLHFCTPFLHPGVMYPAEHCRRIGGYNPQNDVTEDYDMWCRLSRLGPIASLAAKLMKKRIHANAVSVTKRERGFIQSNQIAARYTTGLFPEVDPAGAAGLYWLFITGDLREAPLAGLTKAYSAIRLAYQSTEVSNPELAQAIRYVGNRMGYACHQSALRSWKNPLKANRLLVAAGFFDPTRRNIIRVAIRKMAGATERFQPLNDRIVSEAANMP